MRTLILNAGLALLLAQGGSTLDPAQAALEFNARVQRYVELHRALEGSVPTLAVSSDYAEVVAAIDALAAKLQAARSSARRGDIFTPQVERWFRHVIAKSLEGCDIEDILAALNEENPPGVVFVPRVNGQWPSGASYGPIPPRLLAALPPLPDDLEYHLLNRDLVLWDAHANLVVDFIRGALP